MVVDARPQVVRHQGSVPGAIVVEPSEVTQLFARTRPTCVQTRDTEISVVSVRAEAARIAEQIAELGYTNVHYVDGGFPALRSVASF